MMGAIDMRTETLKLWEGRSDVTLTTYLLDNCFDADPDRRRPALLICPGGGYEYCSDREAEPVAMRFAGMGYHTCVLRYSVTRTAPDAAMVRYPGPLLDIAKAMQILRQNASQWRIDSDRIGICGFSAGAHLCGMLATHWQDAALHEALGAPSALFRPNAAILVYGLLDYSAQTGYLQQTQLPGSDHVSMALLGTPVPTPEEQQRISPACAVTDSCPPVLLIHAADDFLVPVENALHMALALTKAGIPYELHVYETGSHGFSMADATTSTMDYEQHDLAAGWTGQAKTWLARHLPLTVLHGAGSIPTRGNLPRL